MPGLLKLLYENVYVYLPIFVCPYNLTHVSNFLSGKYSFMHEIKAQ